MAATRQCSSSMGRDGASLPLTADGRWGWIQAATRVATALLAWTLLCVPSSEAGAQSVGDVLEALRSGGGWVAVPIEDGRGSVETISLPTGRFTVEGCARVWSGHSGSWRLRAEDLLGDAVMEATLEAGEAIRFRHDPGPRTRLRVDARWSESADTTLFLWVGLGSGSGERDPCEPRR